jgi:hypothetical protein
LFYFFIMPIISFAQGNVPAPVCPPGKICNPLGSSGVNSIPDFIRVLLEGALKVGIPIVALAIIYCGFLFVEARGNTEKLTKAKDALLYTLIGAAILLGSWAIASLIASTVTSL